MQTRVDIRSSIISNRFSDIIVFLSAPSPSTCRAAAGRQILGLNFFHPSVPSQGTVMRTLRGPERKLKKTNNNNIKIERYKLLKGKKFFHFFFSQPENFFPPR